MRAICPSTLCIADDNDDLPKKLREVREESRLDVYKYDIYWCFALSTDIDQMVAELHASRKMVEKYAQMGAQNRISSEENSCLQDEKNAVLSYQNRLHDKFTEEMEKGTGLFRGVSWDASSLGKALSDIYKKLYGNVVPDLYPKLEMGSRPLKGDEAEVILKAADLKALPQVFYAGDKGLGLVTKEGPKYVPNPAADVAKRKCWTISLPRTNTATGTNAPARSWNNASVGLATVGTVTCFGSSWPLLFLRQVHRSLSRVVRSSTTIADPRCRPPFINNNTFKSSLFTPVEAYRLEDVDSCRRVLRSPNRRNRRRGQERHRRSLEEVHCRGDEDGPAHRGPGQGQSTTGGGSASKTIEALSVIESASPDDCVNTLAGGGASLKQAHDRIRKIAECLDDKGLAALRQARQAVGQMWPQLEARGEVGLKEEVEKLKGLLATEEFYESLSAIGAASKVVSSAYRTLYEKAHSERGEQFHAATEKIKGRSEWSAVPDSMRQPVLQPLASRCCATGLICRIVHLSV